MVFMLLMGFIALSVFCFLATLVFSEFVLLSGSAGKGSVN
jgi:hypothetical protein